MAEERSGVSKYRRWAEFRLAIVGPLLVMPMERGHLIAAMRSLADKTWKHPITGDPIQFSVTSIQRWYYCVKGSENPVDDLLRKSRNDRGNTFLSNRKLADILIRQYQEHPSWTRKLHHENLRAMVLKDRSLEPLPSYSTLKRYMEHMGMSRLKKRRGSNRVGARLASTAFHTHETRCYEALFPGALWHIDGHHARRQVVTESGRWITPIGIGVIDDCSRILCHLQWYPVENAEFIIHSYRQSLQKRGVPWAVMTDCGAAMKSAEFTQGNSRISVGHDFTIPYTPEQNAKIERFWGTVESNLMAMLENRKSLTLDELNQATQAWIEVGYNQKPHDELGMSPYHRYNRDDNGHRVCPRSSELTEVFARQITRRPRRFDATIVIDGVRFAIPWQYRHIERVVVRYIAWDLSSAHLMDPDGEKVVARILPLDKKGNSTGIRRAVAVPEITPSDNPEDETAPLLKQMLEEYAATGLPSAYIPSPEKGKTNE